jgi:hypothetical protein
MSTRTAALLVVLSLRALPAPAQQHDGQTVITTQQTGPGQALPGQPAPPQAPARDTKPVEKGTGIIRGRVIGGETGAPLRHASVFARGEGLQDGKRASTDENGRYELKELPAGQVFLQASKGGYVTIDYGQRRPLQSGRPIDLQKGQTVTADFNLPRGGVISGRITDEAGEPAVGASIQVQHRRLIMGKRRLVPAGRFRYETDDTGRFRAYGLPPGEFIVSASMGFGFGPMASDTDSSAGYATTYYPGTASASGAQRVRVVPGGENSTVNFALVPSRVGKVTGTVLMSNGQPPVNAMIMISQPQGDGGFMMNGGGMVRPDGTFTVADLGPGEYTLMIQTGFGTPDGEAAYVPVTMGSEDVTGLAITTSPGSLVTGQAVFDTTAPSSKRPAEFQFYAGSPDPDAFFIGNMVSPKDDWTFETHLHVSPTVINSGRLPDGWTVKAVLQGGVDVTDSGLQFRVGEAVENVQVVLTDRVSTIIGTVATSTGVPAKDYTVVIFPDDQAKWTPNSRYLRTARPSQQGRFEASRLPPGHYLALAVDMLDDDQGSDPEYLAQVRSAATPFDLAEGEKKVLALKLVTDR